MLWVTWRQQRTQILTTAALVSLAAVALAITGAHLASLYESVSACHSACGLATESFRNDAQSGFSGVIYHLSLYGMYIAPPLLGLFWGAPLVARELEAGTHRLAWNQTVSRTRWLSTKLAIGGGLAIAATSVLSLCATVATHHLEPRRIDPELFGARGVVPIAYAAFAYALGVAAGAVLRRTIVAMAVTLAIYAIAVVLMPTVVRAHLLPTRTATAALTADSRVGLRLSPTKIEILNNIPVPNAWTVSSHTVRPDGSTFTGPPNLDACGSNASPKACFQWLGSLHLRGVATYQPASHYWPLQWVESGIFLTLAVLLAGVSLWWTRHRLT